MGLVFFQLLLCNNDYLTMAAKSALVKYLLNSRSDAACCLSDGCRLMASRRLVVTICRLLVRAPTMAFR